MLNIAKQGWHLPWKGRLVPHALIDITRQCNVTCRSCYNDGNWESKSLSSIKNEIETLISLRKLDSVSIIGGEPTLHKDLFAIIEYLTANGLHSELFTNGLLLDDALARELKQAGLGCVFLHVQEDQDRPDLDKRNPRQSMKRLLDEKTSLLKGHGLEVGLSYTFHNDRESELQWMLDYCLENASLGYLLVTMDTDVKNMIPVKGDIFQGMRIVARHVPQRSGDSAPSILNAAERMIVGKDFVPFGYLGSNMDVLSPRWMSFMVLCAYDAGNLMGQVSLKASYLEKGYLQIARLLKGKYPFYGNQKEKNLKLQLFLNSFLGGRLNRNLRFLGDSLKRKYAIKAKKILLQAPACIDDSGKVVHCANCPDAVLKNGKMVPVCISDKVGV
ncbi:MAG: radical SAM protein [Desulforudis sp.]|jgi:hypothetical protein|nr:MAG: radical SAM protein [Desulforudis sp.]